MRYFTEENATEAVLARLENCANPRLKHQTLSSV
jgi:hypothetical protein